MKKTKNIARLLPVDYLKSIGRYSDEVTELLENTIGFPIEMKQEIANSGGKIVHIVHDNIELTIVKSFFTTAGLKPIKMTRIEIDESESYRGWIVPSNWIVKL